MNTTVIYNETLSKKAYSLLLSATSPSKSTASSLQSTPHVSPHHVDSNNNNVSSSSSSRPPPIAADTQASLRIVAEVIMSSRLNKSKERVSYPDAYHAAAAAAPFIYIDYALDANVDTLHTLSMQFGVSIADLKRLNSLQNDRDVYALKLVKIPVKPNSIHTEKYAGQLRYADQASTRLAASSVPVNADLESCATSTDNASGTAAGELSEEERSNAGDTSSPYLVDRAADGQLVVESELVDETSATLPLLGYDTAASRDGRSKTKQAKEAKKYLRALDSNLNALKSQNSEILTNVMKNSEQLVPIQTCSYLVERQQSQQATATGRSGKGFFSLNVRDTLILACIVVIFMPLLFILYRYIYIKEHTGQSLKP